MLRDWFRAAPRNLLKPLTRLRLVQHRADREKISRPSRRYQEAGLADKRSKMLTMWVTEDEHRRLLERCDGKQLAAWMRQTCLDEKPARAGKLPSLSPALLRQLAGMGNNLNQIARQVNAGGGSGHDRVQVVAALMAIDAGLERLRHRSAGEAGRSQGAYRRLALRKKVHIRRPVLCRKGFTARAARKADGEL